jgi:hypothetical protein
MEARTMRLRDIVGAIFGEKKPEPAVLYHVHHEARPEVLPAEPAPAVVEPAVAPQREREVVVRPAYCQCGPLALVRTVGGCGRVCIQCGSIEGDSGPVGISRKDFETGAWRRRSARMNPGGFMQAMARMFARRG